MFASKQTHTPEGVARFTMPDGWTASNVERQGAWSAFHFRRSQTWRIGSGDPLEVDAWVILASARASAADLESGMKFAMQQVEVHTSRFPEFGSMQTGSRTTWMSQGNYQINENHDPEKVLFLRSLDPAKQAALVMRVYLRKIEHEKLRAIEHDFFSSLAYQEGRAKYFNETPVSAGAKQRRADELAYINRFLEKRGLPPVDPLNQTRIQAHDGWVYHVNAGQFVIGRRLGDRPKGEIAESGRGELAWLDYDDETWRAGQPRTMTRPPGNERYFQGQPTLRDWSKVLALDTDRTRRYFFYVWSCELTPEDSPESHDPVTWELEGWFAQVPAVESQFRAGQLKL